MRKITFAQALNEALHEEMMRDEKVLFMVKMWQLWVDFGK